MKKLESPVILALMAFFLFSVSDACMKEVLKTHSFQAAIFVMEIFVLITMGGYCLIRRQRVLKLRRVWVGATYSALFIANLGSFCLLLPRVPFAELFVIVLAIPLVIMAGGKLVLGEELGLRHIGAIIVGVLGVLVMMHLWSPDARSAADTVGEIRKWTLPTIGLAVFHVCSNAAQQLFSRRHAQQENSIALTFFGAAAMVCVSGFWSYDRLADFSPTDVLLVASSGFVAAFATVMVTRAFQTGQASFIAPTQYTQLLWAAIFGYLFWHEAPTMWTYFGGFMLLVSGYILYGPRCVPACINCCRAKKAQ